MDQWWRDFQEFRVLVTPKLMPVIFWIGVAITVIMGIITVVEGSIVGSARLVFLGVVSIFLGPLLVRILCELIMTFFRGKE